MKGSQSNLCASVTRNTFFRLASVSGSRSSRSPLITYLLAEIACLPIQWGSYALLGPGKVYGWVYGISSGLVFLAVFWNVTDALRTRRYRARPLAVAAILAIIFAKLTYSAIPSPTWSDWLMLADGLMLLWAGIILAYSSPYNRPPMVSLVLGWYWMAESLHHFLTIAGCMDWLAGNTYVPQILEILAFGIIFALLRQSPVWNNRRAV